MKLDFNKGSNFCREGQYVKGSYLGSYVEGVVLESRVKYGGKVQHKVETAKSYTFMRELRKAGSIVLVDELFLAWD